MRRFAESALQDVHSQEDDDPHNVDEVPVIPGTSTPRWSSPGAKWPRKSADRRETEQQQPDKDVGSVQAGEAVEDRAEGEVTGAEADVDVLVDLDEGRSRPASRSAAGRVSGPRVYQRRIDSSA